MLEIDNKTKWRNILTETRTVIYKDNTKPGDDKYFYTPISPLYVTTEAYLLLVGVHSNNAKRHWFLGARVSQYLYTSPSSSDKLIQGVQASDIKKAGLERLTLIEFPNHNVKPYVLQVEIPYWLEDVYVEVWEYIGEHDSTSNNLGNIETRFNRIDEQLNTINNKIDNLRLSQGSGMQPNTSTNFDNPDSSSNLGII